MNRLLIGAVVGRLPTSMAALALALTLRAHDVSFQFTGIATAVLAIAQAIGGPALSRLVDRRGQTTVLVVSCVISAAGMLVIVAAPTHQSLVLLGAAVAGAATPPLEPCLRALWPSLVGQENLQKAYSMDAIAQELVFIVGPILVALTVLVWPPTAALMMAALLGIVGTMILATSSPSRQSPGGPSAAGRLGPLRSVPLVVLLIALAGGAVPVGGLNIIAIAYAEVHPIPGGASVLLAIVAIGALIGALLNGHISWSMPPTRLAVLFSGGLASSYLLVATMAPVWLMALICFVAGMFLPPLLVIVFGLVDELAPDGTVVEAFAWLVTLFTVGAAVGTAVAGSVRDSVSISAAAVTTAAIGFAGTAVMLLFLRLYARRPSLVDQSSVAPAQQ